MIGFTFRIFGWCVHLCVLHCLYFSVFDFFYFCNPKVKRGMDFKESNRKSMELPWNV